MGEQKIYGYNREQLMKVDPVILRTFIHERTHHGIEVLLYRILVGKKRKLRNFGWQARLLLEVWKERGLPVDAPDLQWSARYVDIAEKLNAGESITLEEELPLPFSEQEISTVKKLLYERRSIRQFLDKPIPEEILNEIMKAGLMAPQGCNVGSTRFIVLRDPKEMKMMASDIPIENGVMIVVCQDMRVYECLMFDKIVPQNIYFDAAAAADHMVLMAHALGLGACWLTHESETQKKVQQYFGLPETFISRCHIILGWADEAPIKSGRMKLKEAIIGKK
ncbi:MAG: nitroreductase family protein [Candidatus Thorarchaeota archaeon]